MDHDHLTRALGNAVTTRQLDAGEALFRQGDATVGFFRVLSGRVRMLRHTLDGRQVSMHLARTGETFAEPSLFSDRYHCDALAEIASTVALYPREPLLRRMTADPELYLELTERLARLVQSLRTQAEIRFIRSAEERVLSALALRIEDPGGRVRLHGPLKDLACEIGLTHEALYRALRKLERSGRIRRNGRELHVLRDPI